MTTAAAGFFLWIMPDLSSKTPKRLFIGLKFDKNNRWRLILQTVYYYKSKQKHLDYPEKSSYWQQQQLVVILLRIMADVSRGNHLFTFTLYLGFYQLRHQQNLSIRITELIIFSNLMVPWWAQDKWLSADILSSLHCNQYCLDKYIDYVFFIVEV